MIACLLIPGFELRAALRSRPRLAVVPAALAPEPGREQLVGPVTAAAEAAGVIRGMRLGEALATCTARSRRPGSRGRRAGVGGGAAAPRGCGIRRGAGRAGSVVFETRGVERLYGGVEAALRKALASVGPAWDPRAGAGQRRFVALAAAGVARPGQAVIVEEEEQSFLEPLPLSLLPLEEGRYAELEGLGVRARLARRPAWGRRGRAAGAGEAGVEPPVAGAPPRARAIARGRAGRGALLPRGGRERAHPAPRVRRTRWPPPARAGGEAVPEARARRATRRRRVVAPHGDSA